MAKWIDLEITIAPNNDKDEISQQEFFDAFTKFVESRDWSYGGVIKEHPEEK